MRGAKPLRLEPLDVHGTDALSSVQEYTSEAVSGGSSAEYANDAVVMFVGSAGPMKLWITGAVVSIRHVNDCNVVLPTSSAAHTLKLWNPSIGAGTVTV